MINLLDKSKKLKSKENIFNKKQNIGDGINTEDETDESGLSSL